jgi:hypothetical protein
MIITIGGIGYRPVGDADEYGRRGSWPAATSHSLATAVTAAKRQAKAGGGQPEGATTSGRSEQGTGSHLPSGDDRSSPAHPGEPAVEEVFDEDLLRVG